ncbi:hypothetical protein [Sporomusa carbonis]|uniref:hypothetical protein n=1 Tax=Sporomusa carbonis TaxID=3076075 RepID=UPI003C7A73F4
MSSRKEDSIDELGEKLHMAKCMEERESVTYVDTSKSSIDDLIQCIYLATGVSGDDLKGPGRARNVVAARRLLIYVALNNNLATGVELAKMFGVHASQITRGFQDVVRDDVLLAQARTLQLRMNEFITQKRKA